MENRTGYVKASEFVYRTFTIGFSLVALVLVAPLCAVIALAILLVDGPPLFYSSERLGKNKRLFKMYKFRTLVPDAEGRIGASIFQYSLSSNRALLTHTGKFLRETRLDEIPQFINTLRGDMDLIGPRPMRPEQYQRFCKNIPDFDFQFTVRPGLIGYAQLFTPHTAPKRIRSMIDHKFLHRKHLYSSELLLLIISLGMITLRLVGRVFQAIGQELKLLLGPRRERRVLDRHFPKGVTVLIRPEGNPTAAALEVPLLDANEEALAVQAESLPAGPLDLVVRIPIVSRGGRMMIKSVSCTAEVCATKRNNDGGNTVCVLKYQPRSPFQYYLMHQHLMHGSIFRHA